MCQTSESLLGKIWWGRFSNWCFSFVPPLCMTSNLWRKVIWPRSHKTFLGPTKHEIYAITMPTTGILIFINRINFMLNLVSKKVYNLGPRLFVERSHFFSLKSEHLIQSWFRLICANDSYLNQCDRWSVMFKPFVHKLYLKYESISRDKPHVFNQKKKYAWYYRVWPCEIIFS